MMMPLRRNGKSGRSDSSALSELLLSGSAGAGATALPALNLTATAVIPQVGDGGV